MARNEHFLAIKMAKVQLRESKLNAGFLSAGFLLSSKKNNQSKVKQLFCFTRCLEPLLSKITEV